MPRPTGRRNSHPGLPRGPGPRSLYMRSLAGPRTDRYLKPITQSVESSSSDDEEEEEEEGEDFMKSVMEEIDGLGYKRELIFVKPPGYKYIIG